MKVDEPIVSCLLTAGISSNYYARTILSLPHTMHSATLCCMYMRVCIIL